MAVGPSEKFRMADRLAYGQLEEILKRRRAEGASFAVLSRELFVEFGIEVTGQTLSTWWKSLEVAAS